MMHARRHFTYRETEEAQVLQLPYKGHELGFVVVLPRVKNGLAKLEGSLNVERLASWLDKLGPARTIVHLAQVHDRVHI